MSLANRARAEQHATRAAFFIPGFATALWATLVPFAKARTGINDATLGLVLLCLGAGSLLAMPLSGVLAARLGCRRVMVASSLLICLTVPGLALAGSAWTLGVVLFVFGAAVGAMDCTMNVQAVIVEREARRVMMSGFHAFFSIGGFLGAASMTVLLSAQLPPLASVLIGVGTMLLVTLLSATYWHSERMPHDTPMLALPHGIVLFIGVLAFVAFLGEGAMLDWSAVFLAEVRQVPRDQAGAGFALFTLAMTAMRLFGDGIVERLGRTRTLVFGGITAAAGFTLATLVPSFPVALAGYVLVGLGCANIVPALFSMAGQQRVMPESIAITAVTTLGYAGILAGPAAIGALAHGTSLGFAFLCVAALLLGVAASARSLARRVA
ncbi:MAG: MFS transporter [Stenotrophomonas maltophilia]|nr:MFS transporter [Stenotrophomonas maltophilia]